MNGSGCRRSNRDFGGERKEVPCQAVKRSVWPEDKGKAGASKKKTGIMERTNQKPALGGEPSKKNLGGEGGGEKNPPLS